MKFLVIEKDKTSLKNLISTVKEAEPEAKVVEARDFEEALKFKDEEFDVALIDADQNSAANFVEGLKAKFRDTHVIFMSNSKEHMADAFHVHADSYLLKPVQPEDISREVEYLTNHYPAPLRRVKVAVKTFGGFNVYVRGRRLLFKRSKSKELLAILVDHRGLGLTTRQVCSLLFEGREYNELLLGYYHVVLTSLKSTLSEAGVRGIIQKSMNYIAINPDIIDCDMYKYLKGDPEALKSYHGDYMAGYKWSERSRRNEKKRSKR